MDIVRTERGDAPLIVSLPHAGTWLPAGIADAMTPVARHMPDTDWHLGRLYGFAGGLGATVITATHSRYVIDLNRAPDGQALYPGADNTELCPLTTFDHEPVYLPGQEPGQAEIEHRLRTFWQPYHDALAAEIARLHDRHGHVLLWDGHSIRSEVPRFFEGRLPDLNIGTADGTAADPELTERIAAAAKQASSFSVACNDRFKGGYITRHHGRPGKGIHAVQLELSQATYMEEDLPFRYLPESAEAVSAVIEEMISAALLRIRE